MMTTTTTTKTCCYGYSSNEAATNLTHERNQGTTTLPKITTSKKKNNESSSGITEVRRTSFDATTTRTTATTNAFTNACPTTTTMTTIQSSLGNNNIAMTSRQRRRQLPTIVQSWCWWLPKKQLSVVFSFCDSFRFAAVAAAETADGEDCDPRKQQQRIRRITERRKTRNLFFSSLRLFFVSLFLLPRGSHGFSSYFVGRTGCYTDLTKGEVIMNNPVRGADQFRERTDGAHAQLYIHLLPVDSGSSSSIFAHPTDLDVANQAVFKDRTVALDISSATLPIQLSFQVLPVPSLPQTVDYQYAVQLDPPGQQSYAYFEQGGCDDKQRIAGTGKKDVITVTIQAKEWPVKLWAGWATGHEAVTLTHSITLVNSAESNKKEKVLSDMEKILEQISANRFVGATDQKQAHHPLHPHQQLPKDNKTEGKEGKESDAAVVDPQKKMEQEDRLKMNQDEAMKLQLQQHRERLDERKSNNAAADADADAHIPTEEEVYLKQKQQQQQRQQQQQLPQKHTKEQDINERRRNAMDHRKVPAPSEKKKKKVANDEENEEEDVGIGRAAHHRLGTDGDTTTTRMDEIPMISLGLPFFSGMVILVLGNIGVIHFCLVWSNSPGSDGSGRRSSRKGRLNL